MAYVSRDRGQLIILTGLIVAVTMVAMVLLLNTAIYTENLASRGADQSSREAIEYRATVIDSVGGLIEEENAREHDSFADAKSNVTEGIDVIDNYTARSHAIDGTISRINQSPSSMTVTEGRLIRQTTSRPFQNESGTLDDWQLASGVEDDEVRDLRVTVSRSSLEPTVDHGLTVYLEDTSNTTWEAFVYEDGSNVTVATSINGGGKTDVCTVAGSEATIDLTRGTIGDEQCRGLDWAEGLSGDYIVEYHNGENATGTYNMTVHRTGTSIDSTNVVSGPSSTVYHVPAVYSVSFGIDYETPTLVYEVEVRVAPGETR